MTAINIVKQRNRVHLVTDAAYWGPDGRIGCFGAKMFPLPNLPAVIATRGPLTAPFEFGLRFSVAFTSFDDMVDRIEDELPDIYEACLQQFAEELGAMANVDLILAGWSAARNRPEAYLIHSAPNFCPLEERVEELLADGDVINPDAFKLQELDGPIVFAPTVLHEKRAKAGFDEYANERDYPTMLGHMRTLLELQRREVGEWDDVEFYAVGGYATITTVTKNGIEQSVFHRWPEDRVGELIKPAPIDFKNENVVPIASAGMSRQQRRYLERQARKAAKSH